MIVKPNFHSHSIFAENFIAVELRKTLGEVQQVDLRGYVWVYLTYQKSACTNFTTSICYHCFATNVKLCTPTRTVLYIVSNARTFTRLWNAISLDSTRAMDNTVYLCVYSIPLANKKVPGLIKDENNGAIITEFIGRRITRGMHDIRIENRSESDTMSNDTLYRIRRRRYHKHIGGYLCNIGINIYITITFFAFFFYIFIQCICITIMLYVLF